MGRTSFGLTVSSASCRRAIQRTSAVVIASLVLLFIGALGGAYCDQLGAFLHSNGVGEFIHEVAPGVGVIVAICVFAWQANRARYTMRIDLILKLADRFDSDSMRKTRAAAAIALRSDELTNDDAVGDLLDFIEQIGFLLSRGAIDCDAVYEFFEAWVIPYCQKTETYRRHAQVTDGAPDLYSNVATLFRALVERELSRTGTTPHRTPTEIDQFLDREAAFGKKDAVER